MEPINRRPVMDIRPQRPQPRPLPRADFTAATPAAVAPANVPQAPAVEQQPEPAPKTELPKVRTPIAAIVVALLVGSGLIALTVFAYMKTKKPATVADTPSTTTVQKATSDDVDKSVQSTDDELKKLDDTNDFSSTSLSDENLGL